MRVPYFLTLCVAVLGWTDPLRAQDLILSECLTANVSSLPDDDGDRSDWIELFNPSATAVSLEGWSLTDEVGALSKWTFPAVMIPGQGFLTVFASGKNRTAPEGALHTNFALSRAGEYLALVRPDGSVASAFDPAYPPQEADVSYGRRLMIDERPLLSAEAPATMLVSGGETIDENWRPLAFDDAAWVPVLGGIGYDRAGPIGGEPVVPAVDVTQPGDAIVPTSLNSPVGEEVDKAIDGDSRTKYLNFDKLNAGFTVTPTAGASVVTGLRFTSANDAPERDPTRFSLEGSNDGKTFSAIASGAIPFFNARFTAVQVAFENATAYAHYRLLFPTVVNAGAAVAMQIGEVEFLGQTGVLPSTFADLIDTEIGSDVDGVYLRRPFAVPLGKLPKTPRMRVWFDDGFIAYLNGVEIVRVNAPAVAQHNAHSLSDRSREESVQPYDVDLTPFASLFVEGMNLLAVHALNDSMNSPEFLFRAEIVDVTVTLGTEAFFGTPTPGAPNGDAFDGTVPIPVADVARGFFEAPFTLTLQSELEEATIRYTTDGSAPTESNGVAYQAPLTIQKTTVLRVAAFRENWAASPILTNTYLFPNDVIRQTKQAALTAGFPARWSGQTADYGLDARVPVRSTELTALPSISLVLDSEDMFGASGIYANPNARGDAWERGVSFEWLDPSSDEGSFQEKAGIRIQGGAFRRFDLTLKKSFRVIFRERYGASRLDHSLFGPEAAAEADSIVLRANGNDAWVWGGAATLYIRDAFAMESMRAMGNVASHSTFAHLYINGQYWGLYNPAERPDAAFSSIYHGGDANSWDALNQDSVPDGNADAWNRLLAALNAGLSSDANYQRIQGNNPDGTRNPNYEVLLDVDNMIDYMILNFYIGNADWPGRNHWYGINRDGQQGFQFYPWDSETAMGLNSSLNVNRLDVRDSVARPFAAARANAEFRLRFGDRVQKHFFNGGAFHVDPARPNDGEPAKRFAALADLVEPAIAAESSRWGDQLGGTPFTREGHWKPERDDLLKNYFPKRSAIVLDQFRAAGLFPKIEAPSFSQRGGKLPEGFELTMSAGAGAILYTLDGSDPRANVGEALTYNGPISINDLTTVKARARTLFGTWSAMEEATFVVGGARLVISELDYHPAPPTTAERDAGFTDADDFEFVEFYNPSNVTFDLAGARFDDGVTFDFSKASIRFVSSGARFVLVRNAKAFEARFGSAIPIGGEYVGNFANNGERVRVVDHEGVTFVDFAYDDSPPWSATVDGGGESLEYRNPAADPEQAASWSASYMGVSPGSRPHPRPAEGFQASIDERDVVLTFQADADAAYALQVSQKLDADWELFQALDKLTAGPVMIRIPIDSLDGRRFLRIQTK